MYVDAITTAALVAEFREILVEGRVQDVIPVDDQTIGLEIYAKQTRHYLLISSDAQSARCHLVMDRLRRGVEKTSPLYQLMRKYLIGARLTRVSQPPWERVLLFDFSGEEGELRLIVETMDKRSNIILTVDGDILDSIKRVGPDQNRYRVTLPGKTYVPPPPMKKITPAQLKLDDLIEPFTAAPDENAWRILVKLVAGVSPLFAREVIYFASGDAQAPAFDVDPAMVFAAFNQRVQDVQDGRWTPCVVQADGGYLAFAAYSLTHHADWRETESISQAMALYFGAPIGESAYDAAREPVVQQIREAIARLKRKIRSMERQAASHEDIESLRQKGELILAYGPSLPKGERSFTAQYDPDAPNLMIDLDPRLSFSENAQAYFARYDKAKSAAKKIPRVIARTKHEISFLQQAQSDLSLAESRPEIESIKELLQEEGYWQGQKTRGPSGGQSGIRRFTEDGFNILVGRNAKQNHELVTKKSQPGDLWLHVRGVPGSHVVIKNDGRDISDAVIRRAAEYAAYYSSRRGDANVDVIVTDRRHVRPVRGGKPGMVRVTHDKNVTVTPQG